MTRPSHHRALLVLVAIQFGIIAGLVAGIVLASGQASVSNIVLGCGGAFGGTVPLVLLVEKELGLLS